MNVQVWRSAKIPERVSRNLIVTCQHTTFAPVLVLTHFTVPKQQYHMVMAQILFRILPDSAIECKTGLVKHIG